jgi:hypothetical protein
MRIRLEQAVWILVPVVQCLRLVGVDVPDRRAGDSLCERWCSQRMVEVAIITVRRMTSGELLK